MTPLDCRFVPLGVAFLALGHVCAVPAHAAIIVSEVAPWSSSNANPTSFGADWFELTNTGSNAVAISGWKMDDNSNSLAAAVALTGVTSIAAGQSVVFIEGPASLGSAFRDYWFGANAPAGLQIGFYSGGGVGLSQAGDAVNIFDALGSLQAKVTFGLSSVVAPLRTLDNAVGLNNAAIATPSALGVNGAFTAARANEIGSPGSIANAAIPVPAAALLFGPALMVARGAARKRGTA